MLELDRASSSRIARFLERRRKLGAQVGDAALIYLAERDGFDIVFTLDRRDFSVYRLADKRTLQILPVQ